MITRIVKLTFKPGTEVDFKAVFEASAPVIKTFDGCLGVSLFNEINSTTIFFTVSKWESEEALNNYRSSPFFKETWAKTKVLFESKAEAWSINEVA